MPKAGWSGEVGDPVRIVTGLHHVGIVGKITAIYDDDVVVQFAGDSARYAFSSTEVKSATSPQEGTTKPASSPSRTGSNPSVKASTAALYPGQAVKVVAPGDDFDGRVGTIFKVIDDDEDYDDMDVFVKFADEDDAFAFRRDEVILTSPDPTRPKPIQRRTPNATSPPRAAPELKIRSTAAPDTTTLLRGQAVKVVAPGDDFDGRVGTIFKVIDDDEDYDDMDVFVKFADEDDAFAFRRDEVAREPMRTAHPSRPAEDASQPQKNAASRTRSTTPPKAAPKNTSSANKKTSPAVGQPTKPGSPSVGSDSWNAKAQMVARSGQSWLQSIKDIGPNAVQRGSGRWVTGVAMLVGGAVLILSTLLVWGRTTSDGYAIAMSGLGQVSVHGPNSTLTSFLEEQLQGEVGPAVFNPGIWTALVGVLSIFGGLAYLWTARRSEASIVVAVACGVDFLACISNATSLGSMMGDVSDSDSYTIGFGLLLACALTLILVALAVTAFVLERISMNNR